MVIRTKRSFRLPLSMAVSVGVFIVGIYSYTTLAASFSTNREPIANQSSRGLKAVVTEANPEPSQAETPRASSLLGAKLYTDPSLRQAGRPAEIADTPAAIWFGDWTIDIKSEVRQIAGSAQQANQLPTFVLYNIPQRDCGLYSAGGAADSNAYRSWLDDFSAGLGGLPAIVVLEPDALLQLDCLSALGQASRLADLNYAIDSLATAPAAMTYVDAGNASWKTPTVVVKLLRQLALDKVAGFALNVSNFDYTKVAADYGDAIATQLDGKRYIIDTSRNGNGPAADKAWCNPPGRGLGLPPTTQPDYGQYVDAYLWIKNPGESDGDANGAPAAGQWYEDYAQMLIANAAVRR